MLVVQRLMANAGPMIVKTLLLVIGVELSKYCTLLLIELQ